MARLAFDDNGDGQPEEVVDLRGEHPDWPQFIIVLDGVPFDVVEAMYREGHFRLFAAPTRLVSVFPAMTDVALSRVFHTPPCVAVEAQYFDRRKNGVSSANDVYLSGENAPWSKCVDYCAPQDIAVKAYLDPWAAFWTELGGMDRLFRTTKQAQAAAYSVGTAGIGTREGEAGIRRYLAEVEKLSERITYERRGRVRLSMLADHGHGLRKCRRITLDEVLTKAGFRVAKSINQPNDVVIVSYGLVTCAQLYARRPGDVAAALVHHPDVDLAVFRENDRVVVQNAAAKAALRPGPGGYVYERLDDGDPLELGPIIERLRAEGHVGDDGVIEDRPLLEATATHKYPDALRRLWLCFDGEVREPADLIVSLKPEACHGSAFFHFFIGDVASTHGSLEYLGSTTFLMTNATSEPLPPVLRLDDVMATIHAGPKRVIP